MIELMDVAKSYRTSRGEVQALHPTNLMVEAGRMIAIRGTSGAGKTTLLSLIAGLTSPSAGVVRVSGQDITAMNSSQCAAWRARNIGFVFQGFHLLPYLNIEQNILVARGGDLPLGDARAEAARLMQHFGIDHRRTHRPNQLSSGERQRAAMARALLNHPSLLLADEPTGNLDQTTAGLVMDWVQQFHRDGGTVLLVTHDDAVAARAESQIAIADGRLVTAEQPA